MLGLNLTDVSKRGPRSPNQTNNGLGPTMTPATNSKYIHGNISYCNE